jgi:shikimate 5-dehydrogenase
MLVNQAAQSFKKWFGVLPSVFEVITELQDLKNE